MAASTLRRCPIVFTAHGLLFGGFEPPRRRYRLFSRRVSRIVAVSEEVGNRHRDYLNWSDAIEVIANGVPARTLTKGTRERVRESLGIPLSGFVFLAVGNPRVEKAFEVLVAAADSVLQRNESDEVFVLIAGKLSDNDYCRTLQQMVDDVGQSNVRLLGYRPDVGDLYAATDAFVLSSRSEGLPMVILEAMMAGLPVVATRVGGIPQVLPPECGLLVAPDRENELADAMVHLLTMGREVRDEMSRFAAQWAFDNFSVRRMTDEYVKAYSGAIAGRA
jgi:glycosyltransferase involved in cell wall biosynthesis